MSDTGDDRHVQRRFVIKWAYKQEAGTVVYEDESKFGLIGHNASCDCNKLMKLGDILTPEKYPELYFIKGDMYPDGSGPVDETEPRCGDQIKYIAEVDSQGQDKDLSYTRQV
jgi:hypothetical protein